MGLSVTASSDVLRTLADFDDALSDPDRLTMFYWLAGIYGDGYGSGTTGQQAILDQLLLNATAAETAADGDEADQAAQEAFEARLNDTITHRTTVDVPASAAALTAKQAELKALQDAATGTVPAIKADEYNFLTAVGATEGIPIT